MDILDYILLGAIVAALHRAIGYIMKNKGGCSGDCAKCAQSCRKREDCQNETDQR